MQVREIIKVRKGKAPLESAKGNEIIYLTPEYLRGNSAPNYVAYSNNLVLVSDDDVLLLWDGSNAGEVFNGKVGALASTMVKLLFDAKRYHKDFIYYHFKYHEAYIRAQTNGSGIPHVDKEILNGIQLLPFNYDVQKNLCEILASVDSCIIQTRSVIKKQERIKMGMMLDLLTYGIDESGQLRSFEKHKFNFKNGINVPVEWDVDTIDSRCLQSAFGPRFPGTLYSLSGTIGTLRTTDLDLEGNIDYSTIPFAALNPNDFSKHLLLENDLLITRSGTVGLVSVFKKQHFEIIPGAFLIRFRFNETILPEFLRYYFITEPGKRKLLDIAEGGVQKNIRGSAILKLNIPIPPKEEQQMIVNRLDEIENCLKQNHLSLAKLQSLKSGLMQHLLTGEVKVPESITNPVN
ncbi:MAG: Restriction endonuclease subunit-like protein [Mucilaginibacter sp.]|nr:Restriction endonuclease subunit-like protein [Mucilaginibacter sp.]